MPSGNVGQNGIRHHGRQMCSVMRDFTIFSNVLALLVPACRTPPRRSCAVVGEVCRLMNRLAARQFRDMNLFLVGLRFLAN